MKPGWTTRGSRRALRPNHALTLLRGGAELFPAMVEAFDAAREEVLLETYILDISRSVVPVAEALERAAARGVTVRVVVDGIGTGPIPDEWAARWRAAGLSWRVFNPAGGWRVVLPKGWRRMHRKLCVVDRTLGFCGGINLLDDHYDPHHGELERPRLDFGVRVTGPLVQDIHETMTRLWSRLQIAREARRGEVGDALKAARASARAGADAGDESIKTAKRRLAPGPPEGAHAVLVLRDNVRFRRSIESVYRLAINQARSEVVIANAYFIPGVQLQRALLHAVRRGVRVTLLLQAKYEYFMQYHASRAVYGALLAAGIEIIEYEASFLHAKVAVMDSPLGAIATVGSSNLDPLSLLLAREANVFVRDEAFAGDLRRQLLDAMGREGRRVLPDAHSRRPATTRALSWIAYAMMRFAVFATGRRY